MAFVPPILESQYYKACHSQQPHRRLSSVDCFSAWSDANIGYTVYHRCGSEKCPHSALMSMMSRENRTWIGLKVKSPVARPVVSEVPDRIIVVLFDFLSTPFSMDDYVLFPQEWLSIFSTSPNFCVELLYCCASQSTSQLKIVLRCNVQWQEKLFELHAGQAIFWNEKHLKNPARVHIKM